METAIWIVALLLYLAFRAWYDNWRGPMTKDEVAAFMAKARAIGGDGNTDPATIERFLAEDDGREFFMLNLVKVANPDALRKYTQPFMRRLMMRGGHPAFAAQKLGGHIDSWNVPPDPDWTIVGYMRYRSRRDLADLAFNPAFAAIHKFKIEGISQTFSFPTRPFMMMMAGPRLWVGLVLALIAALADLILR